MMQSSVHWESPIAGIYWLLYTHLCFCIYWWDKIWLLNRILFCMQGKLTRYLDLIKCGKPKLCDCFLLLFLLLYTKVGCRRCFQEHGHLSRFILTLFLSLKPLFKVILCASDHICSIVRYCFRSFKQL